MRFINMTSRHALTILVLTILRAGVAFADPAAGYDDRVRPVLEKFCTQCHGDKKQKAEVNLAGPRALSVLMKDQELWFKVLEKLESGEMPPEDEKQPSDSERRAVIDWIRRDLTDMLIARQREEGRSVVRRLNRMEYANTIQDLFGLRAAVEVHLPEDRTVNGFDKVASALSLSASGVEGYFRMAEEMRPWVLRYVPKPAETKRYRPTDVNAGFINPIAEGYVLQLEDGTAVTFNSDDTTTSFNFATKTPGMHRLRFCVYGYQTDKPIAFGVYVGHPGAYPPIVRLAATCEAPPGKPAVVETEIYLNIGVMSGGRQVKVPDYVRVTPLGLGAPLTKATGTKAKGFAGPGLAIAWMEVVEPQVPIVGDTWLTADFPAALNEELRQYSYWLSSETSPDLKQIKSTSREEFLATLRATFSRVGARLYRRDLTEAEVQATVDDVARQIDAGGKLRVVFFDKILDMLTTPDFLCLVEQPGPLNDFALASRLSYFLWNSTPDEALLTVARAGRLRDPQVLRQQTERLLKDPKSQRFVSDFVSQWLGLRAINDTSPDRVLYPEYDDYLRVSSVMETEAFFRRLLDENLGVRHFVDSPWVLVNERLSKHYGLPQVTGLAMRPVDLPQSSPRGGFWTQAAVLKVTANGTNTSPVKRGVWVAQRLLGIHISPPPPNIDPVAPDIRGAKTIREQLDLHRKQASCAACHAKFDPYGFALESFDVTGHFQERYREADPEVVKRPYWEWKGLQTWRHGLPVNAGGQLPDGRAFAGIQELRKLVAQRPEQLAQAVTRHLVTYATGAPAKAPDQAQIDRIVKSTAEDGYGLRSLIHALVQSELFTWK